jgi:hypothetical protein
MRKLQRPIHGKTQKLQYKSSKNKIDGKEYGLWIAMNKRKIKIIQVNTARTATANEDLLIYARNEKIDIALIQEPYVRYGKLVGLETKPFRIILAP